MTVISRKDHLISRKNISDSALKVLYKLNNAGYEAYLVGGGVRDLLLGKEPKDFDVTTNATPEQIRRLFRNCRLVGRRFRLAHVIFGTEIVEVATFRGNHKEKIPFNRATLQLSQNGILLRDNIFGSIEEDAQRRDFTVNSLYYSAIDFTVRDYVGGMNDIRKGIIRFIGDPETRYREDPVRMLRAIRFSARLNMSISEETASPIPRLASLVSDVPSARLFEEAMKLFQAGCGYKTYKLMRKYSLFQFLFPIISRNFADDSNDFTDRIITQALKNIDSLINNDMFLNPSFLFSAMFWYPLIKSVNRILKKYSLNYYDAFMLATNNVLDEVCLSLAIPKRITKLIKDVWQLQVRMSRRQGKRACKIIEHPRFRIAYDLLSLRAKIEHNPELLPLARWWDEFQISKLQEKNLNLIKKN